MSYLDDVKSAMEWAKDNKPEASLQHKAAFANSVAYLMTGVSGGYGGPSLREHLVSWSLGSVIGSASIPGTWTFERATKYCVPLCFGPASDHQVVLRKIQAEEFCFDDDPADVEALLGKPV